MERPGVLVVALLRRKWTPGQSATLVGRQGVLSHDRELWGDIMAWFALATSFLKS